MWKRQGDDSVDIWQGLDEFLSVVSEGTFTAAAHKNGVSVAHISRQIGYLEERLGVVLFKRNTRKMVLTENGQFYAKELHTIKRRVIDLNERVQGDDNQPMGPIAVSCSVGFASREMTSYLAQFAKMYPKVQLTVDFSPRNVDLVDDGFDLAIRFGKPGDGNVLARQLSRRPMTLLASPDYLAIHGEPKHPNDLANHNCLVAKNRRWRFVAKDRPLLVNVDGNWRSVNADALINACLSGLGLAYLARDLVSAHLDQGQLVSLLPDYCASDNGTWLLYPKLEHVPLRIQLLIDFLVSKHS